MDSKERDNNCEINDKELRIILQKLSTHHDYNAMIAIIITLSHYIRKHGPLCLEKLVVYIKEPLIRSMARCIINGATTSSMNTIADNHIRQAMRDYYNYLNIAKQGMMAIESGANPVMVGEQIYSILGKNSQDEDIPTPMNLISKAEINKLLNL